MQTSWARMWTCIVAQSGSEQVYTIASVLPSPSATAQRDLFLQVSAHAYVQVSVFIMHYMYIPMSAKAKELIPTSKGLGTGRDGGRKDRGCRGNTILRHMTQQWVT